MFHFLFSNEDNNASSSMINVGNSSALPNTLELEQQTINKFKPNIPITTNMINLESTFFLNDLSNTFSTSLQTLTTRHRLTILNKLMKINQKWFIGLIVLAFLGAQIGNIFEILLISSFKLNNQMINYFIGFLFDGIISSIFIGFWYMIHFKTMAKKNIQIFNLECQALTLEYELNALKNKNFLLCTTSEQKMAIFSFISNSIRNPLQKILYESEHAKNTHYWNQEAAFIITLAARHIKKVTDSLLYLNQIESQKENSNEIFSLEQLAKEVFTPFASYTKKIKLLCTSSVHLNTVFEGDITKLKSILNNFISNAIQFSQTIFIEQSFVELYIKKEHTISPKIIQFIFIIRDNGKGITPEQKKNIFTLNNTTEFSLSSPTAGLGIGLYITSLLIEKLNEKKNIKDHLGFISELGQGSIFWFRTHLKKSRIKLFQQNSGILAQESTPSNTLLNNLTDKHLHILVVEDQKINHNIIESLLTELGHIVSFANNGQEAIDLLSTKPSNLPYNLVLMDLDLPIINGLEVTRILITQFNLKIPIIGCIEYSTEENISKCLAVGMQDVILKPINSQKLKALLNKIFLKNTTQHFALASTISLHESIGQPSASHDYSPASPKYSVNSVRPDNEPLFFKFNSELSSNDSEIILPSPPTTTILTTEKSLSKDKDKDKDKEHLQHDFGMN